MGTNCVTLMVRTWNPTLGQVLASQQMASEEETYLLSVYPEMFSVGDITFALAHLNAAHVGVTKIVFVGIDLFDVTPTLPDLLILAKEIRKAVAGVVIDILWVRKSGFSERKCEVNDQWWTWGRIEVETVA